MKSSRSGKPRRKRIGRVSVYKHHGSWHLYYRDGQQQIRRAIGLDKGQSEQAAAEVNAHLSSGLPTMFSYLPLTVNEVRQRFLDQHEYFLRSSLATVRRYRAATKYLADYAGMHLIHLVDVDGFVRHLRTLRVAPNGHEHTTKRPLRDKVIAFILGVCRSLYSALSEFLVSSSGQGHEALGEAKDFSRQSASGRDC